MAFFTEIVLFLRVRRKCNKMRFCDIDPDTSCRPTVLQLSLWVHLYGTALVTAVGERVRIRMFKIIYCHLL